LWSPRRSAALGGLPTVAAELSDDKVAPKTAIAAAEGKPLSGA
jgi:hypothetical protein